MRKIIVAVFGIVALLALSACQDKAPGIPVGPKWKGPAYRIAFDAPPAKPNPSGVTIPGIKFTANPDALERRAVLVVKFDSSGLTGKKKDEPIMNQMVMAPTDISGTEGRLPDDYLNAADKELAKYLGAYCVKGKISISVVLTQSSISNNPTDAEVDTKRISDWLTTDVAYKNPHGGGC